MATYNPIKRYLSSISIGILLFLLSYFATRMEGPFKAAGYFSLYVAVPVIFLAYFWSKWQRRIKAINDWVKGGFK